MLTRVAYRGQEVTAPRLRGLLALLAEDLRAGMQYRPARAGAVERGAARAARQGGAGARLAGAGAARRRRHRQHAGRLPLALAEDQVDSSALLLHAAASEARAGAGEHERALAEAEAGLALWDGVVDGAEDPHDPVAALRLARAPAYRTLERSKALALARLGRRADALRPLVRLASGTAPRRGDAGGAAALRGGHHGPRRRAHPLRHLPARPARHARRRPGRRTQRRSTQELLRGEAPAGAARRAARAESAARPGRRRRRRHRAVARRARRHRRRARRARQDAAGPRGRPRWPSSGGALRAAGRRHRRRRRGRRGRLGARRRRRARRARWRPGSLTGIIGALGPGPALLVLDNCEHVIRGAADLVGPWCRAPRSCGCSPPAGRRSA